MSVSRDTNLFVMLLKKGAQDATCSNACMFRKDVDPRTLLKFSKALLPLPRCPLVFRSQGKIARSMDFINKDLKCVDCVATFVFSGENRHSLSTKDSATIQDVASNARRNAKGQDGEPRRESSARSAT